MKHMKRLALISVMLWAMPAAAQSFYPNLAGQRYCQLRQSGVDHLEAIRVAIRENWAPQREPVMVMRNGESVYVDVIDMSRWVRDCR
jgi:hypothetical protein